MSGDTQQSTDQVIAVLDLARKACDAYQRPDLAERLASIRARAAVQAIRVLVVGEFKQGKSSLVNALIGVDVCPVDDDIATSLPTVVRYSERPVALAHRIGDSDDPPPPQEIEPTAVADLVSETGDAAASGDLRLVEVGLPSEFLRNGLHLIDTPGVGGLGSRHASLTLAALPAADAVLLVSDASQEYTSAEIRFLEHAAALCPHIFGVITKVDLYPEWRKVVDLNQQHLERLGFEFELLPVSSTLRAEAVRRNDRGINEESGFPDLRRFLHERVRDASRLMSAHAAANVIHVCGQLEAKFAAEREALTDPETAEQKRQELEEARSRADRLRQDTARWQLTLNDGVADLNADIDHDFRSRTRIIVSEAEARLDEVDPGEVWDEFRRWLEERVNDEIAQNFRLLHSRADELIREVAELFAVAEDEVSVDISVEMPFERLAEIAGPQIELGTASGVKGTAGKLATRGFGAIRGSYGGYMMFNMIGGMVGLAALNPAVLGLTALMGRKTLRDEKAREMAQRRLQAKSAVRKYTDEVSFRIGKESRDTLRRLQRAMRDGFTARAEEIQSSMHAAIRQAEGAAVDGVAREQRIANVDAELARIAALAERARALTSQARQHAEIRA